VRPQVSRPEGPDARRLVRVAAADLAVDLLLARGVGRVRGLGDPGVDSRVAHARLVPLPARLGHVERHRRRVLAAPVVGDDRRREELSRPLLLRHVLDLDVDPALGQRGLEDDRHLRHTGQAGRPRLGLPAVAVAGLSEQRLRLLGVVRGRLEALGVERVLGMDEEVGDRRRRSLRDDVDESLAVHQHLDRSAHARVVVRLGSHVDAHRVREAEGVLQHLDALCGLELSRRAVVARVGEVDVAADDRLDLRRHVGHREAGDAVEMGQALLPVVRVSRQLEALAALERDASERPGAHRAGSEVGVSLDDAAVPEGQLDREEAIGLSELESDRRRVGGEDAVGREERTEDRIAVKVGPAGEHARERVLHVTRVERLAGVELDASAQLERVGLAVARGVPVLGQHRRDLPRVVDAEQRVVEHPRAQQPQRGRVELRVVGVLRRLVRDRDLDRAAGSRRATRRRRLRTRRGGRAGAALVVAAAAREPADRHRAERARAGAQKAPATHVAEQSADLRVVSPVPLHGLSSH
jgi:hypothetical protein